MLELEARHEAGQVTLRLPDGSMRSFEARHLHGPEWMLRDGRDVHRVLVARRRDQWWIWADGRTHVLETAPQREHREAGGTLTAPMPGSVLELLVKEGASVEAGQPLLVLSAMKMQIEIKSPFAGTVTQLPNGVGDQVDAGCTLAVVEPIDQESA